MLPGRNSKYIFLITARGQPRIRAAEGPPSGPPPFLGKNEVAGRPRGARGRPREAPRTLQDPQKPQQIIQNQCFLVVLFKALYSAAHSGPAKNMGF